MLQIKILSSWGNQILLYYAASLNKTALILNEPALIIEASSVSLNKKPYNAASI